jgi:hypothetical protein
MFFALTLALCLPLVILATACLPHSEELDMATTKPTDNILWAESAGGADVADPSTKRTNGWVENDPLPYNSLNYLLRSGGRYSNFCARAFGADNGQLTLEAQHGYIELTADPANLGAGQYHTYTHVATGASVLSRFRGDALQADALIILGNDDAAGGTIVDLTNNVKGLARVRLEVNAGGTGWDVTSLGDFNMSGGSASTGTGLVTVPFDDVTNITALFAQVTAGQLRDGSNNPIASRMVVPQFQAVSNGGVVFGGQLFDGSTLTNFITSYPAGGTIGHHIEFMVLAQ